jgi:hypothetical protein
MAHLAASRLRAQDNSGNAYSSATLTVYETGTTTKADLYSTAALALAGAAGDLANPVTADSAGYFPTVFVSETAVVDMICETSGGTDLWQVNGVQGVPGSTEGFTLDLGEDGRAQIVGRNNIVNLEFGDPTGDDTGGDARIGGWNDTQATAIEIDAATTTFSGNVAVTGNETISGNATVTGTLTVGSGVLDVVLTEGTLSGATTAVIPIPSGYTSLEIELRDMITGTNASVLTAHLSFDNGSTYKVGGTDYRWTLHDNVTVTNDTTGDPEIQFLAGLHSTIESFATVRVLKMATETYLFWTGYTGNAGGIYTGAARTFEKDYGTLTHIRLTSSLGNLSLTYVIRTRKKVT